jgi:hypothetical protein
MKNPSLPECGRSGQQSDAIHKRLERRRWSLQDALDPSSGCLKQIDPTRPLPVHGPGIWRRTGADDQLSRFFRAEDRQGILVPEVDGQAFADALPSPAQP